MELKIRDVVKGVSVLHLQHAERKLSERADGFHINLFVHTVVHTSGSATVAKDVEYWFCWGIRVKYSLFFLYGMPCLFKPSTIFHNTLTCKRSYARWL